MLFDKIIKILDLLSKLYSPSPSPISTLAHVINIMFMFKLLYVLCILTSKLVIRTPFAGWNHVFLHLNKFFHIFPSQTEKERKAAQEHAQNCIKRGVYQRWGGTLKRWLTSKSWSTSGENVWFRPANGMPSTRRLVEIHNMYVVFYLSMLCFLFQFIIS